MLYFPNSAKRIINLIEKGGIHGDNLTICLWQPGQTVGFCIGFFVVAVVVLAGIRLREDSKFILQRVRTS